MSIRFIPFSQEHIPIWQQWVNIDHIKEVWFVEGYELAEMV